MEVKFVIINESLIMTHTDNSCQDDVFGSPVRSFHSDCLKLMNYEISSHRLQKKNIESGIMNQGLADNRSGSDLWLDVGGQGRICPVLARPDRQTTGKVFFKSLKWTGSR